MKECGSSSTDHSKRVQRLLHNQVAVDAHQWLSSNAVEKCRVSFASRIKAEDTPNYAAQQWTIDKSGTTQPGAPTLGYKRMLEIKASLEAALKKESHTGREYRNWESPDMGDGIERTGITFLDDVEGY